MKIELLVPDSCIAQLRTWDISVPGTWSNEPGYKIPFSQVSKWQKISKKLLFWFIFEMKCICFAALGQRRLGLIPSTPEVDPILEWMEVLGIISITGSKQLSKTHLLFVLFRVCIHNGHVGQFEVVVAEDIFRNSSYPVLFSYNNGVIRRSLAVWGKLELPRDTWQC